MGTLELLLVGVGATVVLLVLGWVFGVPKILRRGAGVFTLLLAFYLAFKGKPWKDALEEADQKLKEEDKETKKEKERVKEEREKTDEKIEDSKDKVEDAKDQLDDVEDDVKKPDDSPEDLKDWVEGFADKEN